MYVHSYANKDSETEFIVDVTKNSKSSNVESNKPCDTKRAKSEDDELDAVNSIQSPESVVSLRTKCLERGCNLQEPDLKRVPKTAERQKRKTKKKTKKTAKGRKATKGKKYRYTHHTHYSKASKKRKGSLKCTKYVGS